MNIFIYSNETNNWTIKQLNKDNYFFCLNKFKIFINQN